ncbi:hypothetical protein BH10ACI1_BH10ACI1_22070 [soil metagenome]
MGLFDNLKCEYPLNEKENQELIFQTKSLYCFMESYTISVDGFLFHDSKFWGRTKVAFSGEIHFYSSRGSHQDKNFEWIEYRTKFVEGKLDKLERIQG